MRGLIKAPLKLLTRNLSLWHQVIQDKSVLEMARNRCLVASALFMLAFMVIAGRLTEIMVIRSGGETHNSDSEATQPQIVSRKDIIDRHGEILATHLITASVYANPKVIINPEEAARKLSNLIPELEYDSLLKKLKSDKGFIWIIRHVPPKLQQAINQLGIPGIYLQRDQRRVYPYGRLVSHVIGYCGIDGEGLSGIEKKFDDYLRIKKGNKESGPLQLSVDVRVQHVVYDELMKGIEEFQAEGGNAIVMDVETGEILSMVSFPDFNPNLPNEEKVTEATFNRNTLGAYESGSTFKIYNTAIALETGKATLTSRYDASSPIRVGSKKIDDFKGKYRVLDVTEIFIYSSNIGSAKMALDFGAAAQKDYLQKFGMFDSPKVELPEVGHPLVPKTWREVTTMTVAYGYGIAVSPLQLIAGVAGIINNGYRHEPTLLKIPANMPLEGRQVVSPKTSKMIRHLMRLVVTDGTAKTADVPGYEVIGKTGTAHKTQGRGYANKAKLSSFVGAFPKNKPKYILILFLDNPKPTKKTHGYATGGWTAAPVAGRIISRIAPLMGVVPIAETERGDYISNNNLIPVNHILGQKRDDETD
jgi:cell division protein FtsI (penicillin-binding protein 3)